MHYSFRGNPNTNDAGRYSLALKHWRDGGSVGPPPPRPASLQAHPEAAPSKADARRLARKLQSEREAMQGRLF